MCGRVNSHQLTPPSVPPAAASTRNLPQVVLANQGPLSLPEPFGRPIMPYVVLRLGLVTKKTATDPKGVPPLKWRGVRDNTLPVFRGL